MAEVLGSTTVSAELKTAVGNIKWHGFYYMIKAAGTTPLVLHLMCYGFSGI